MRIKKDGVRRLQITSNLVPPPVPLGLKKKSGFPVFLVRKYWVEKNSLTDDDLCLAESGLPRFAARIEEQEMNRGYAAQIAKEGIVRVET